MGTRQKKSHELILQVTGGFVASTARRPTMEQNGYFDASLRVYKKPPEPHRGIV